MYLLSNYKSSRKESWKLVSKFIQVRTSTQIRTHVQKVRNKIAAQLADLDDMIRTVDEALAKELGGKGSANSKKQCVLDESRVKSIEERWLEYLQLIKIARESGIKYEENKVKYKFEDILVENGSIPNFIVGITRVSHPDHTIMIQAELNKIMHNSSKLRKLLVELKAILEQEKHWAAMKPDRVKSKEVKSKVSERASSKISNSEANPVENPTEQSMEESKHGGQLQNIKQECVDDSEYIPKRHKRKRGFKSKRGNTRKEKRTKYAEEVPLEPVLNEECNIDSIENSPIEWEMCDSSR